MGCPICAQRKDDDSFQYSFGEEAGGNRELEIV
jgi:hypothetical protein